MWELEIYNFVLWHRSSWPMSCLLSCCHVSHWHNVILTLNLCQLSIGLAWILPQVNLLNRKHFQIFLNRRNFSVFLIISPITQWWWCLIRHQLLVCKLGSQTDGQDEQHQVKLQDSEWSEVSDYLQVDSCDLPELDNYLTMVWRCDAPGYNVSCVHRHHAGCVWLSLPRIWDP